MKDAKKEKWMPGLLPDSERIDAIVQCVPEGNRMHPRIVACIEEIGKKDKEWWEKNKWEGANDILRMVAVDLKKQGRLP